MKLDEDNPCPHCGNMETLTDRTDEEFKPVIPKDLQFDFKKGAGAKDNIFIVPTPQELYGEGKISINGDLPKSLQSSLPEGQLAPPVQANSQPENSPTRISQDIPLDTIIPTLENVSLDPASQK
ncbi:MAG: hypothetical protein ACFFDT_39880, partial [Candidatus Hodarchaeota archaeon]